MGFKQLDVSKLGAATLGISILLLALQDKLTLYIHPRYELFTIVMVCIGFILILSEKSSTQQSIQTKSVIALTVVIIGFMSMPPATLTSQTAQNRRQESASIQSKNTSSYDNYTRDYTHFTIQDWSAFFASSPSVAQVVGKEAEIEGFILRDSQDIYAARFRLSCCAVDATPLTIRVAMNEQSTSLTSGAWYRLSGIFTEGASGYELTINEAIQIAEPKEPYVF